jgi:hypothetical protein
LVLVYLGASTCGWSNAAGMPELIDSVKIAMAQVARARGWSFEAVGIALDWDPEAGFAHLQKMGRFDEVATGYNWGNTLAMRYFGEYSAEAPSTPELILVHRFLNAPNFESGPFMLEVTDEGVLYRAVGGIEIQRWARNHFPVPASAQDEPGLMARVP